MLILLHLLCAPSLLSGTIQLDLAVHEDLLPVPLLMIACKIEGSGVINKSVLVPDLLIQLGLVVLLKDV